jgi:hypothetical protein
MKVSKKVRELAATMASACACSGEHQFGVCESFKAPHWIDAIGLLGAAYKVASVAHDDGARERDRQEWAEAEAMLRTGWSP